MNRCEDLRAAAVDRLQVVLPFARGLCELVHELEAVGPELRVGTLVESGVVAPPRKTPSSSETPYVRRTPRESKYSRPSPSPDSGRPMTQIASGNDSWSL